MTALPFEQQPKESNKAFAAFSLYLSLGPDRSTAAVAAGLAVRPAEAASSHA
jgi:hypothetical protein